MKIINYCRNIYLISKYAISVSVFVGLKYYYGYYLTVGASATEIIYDLLFTLSYL